MKVKYFPTLFFLLFVAFISSAQVGINTAIPDDSSILDIFSSNKGVLFPRMDLGDVQTASPVTQPAKGLIVWNTDLSNSGADEGFYYWDGQRWQNISSVSRNSAATTGALGWSFDGNTIDDNDFLGSTNYKSLIFKTNDRQVAKFHPQAGAISLGFNARANDNRGVAIGSDALVSSNDGIALGTSSNAAFRGVAIGPSSRASTNQTVAIGHQSEATVINAVALGKEASSNGQNGLALGYQSNTSGLNSVALGNAASSSGQNATAIGYQSTAIQPNSLILGKYNDIQHRVGIGTLNPTAKLHLEGSLRFEDGNEAAGNILVSDQDGNASWQSINNFKAYGQVIKNNDSNLNSNTYLNFGNTVFNSNIRANNNNFQAEGFTGIYRINFKVTLTKRRGGPATVAFFVATDNNSNNKLPGSESFVEVDSGDTVTVSGETMVRLSPFQQVGVFSNISDNNIQVLHEGTSMNIELICKP